LKELALRLHLWVRELPCPKLEENAMSESDLPTMIGRTKILLLSIAGVYALASLFLLFEMHERISKVETAQAATNSDLSKLNQHLDSEESTMHARTGALAEKVGMTEKWLRARTAELRRQQEAVARLEKEQTEQIESVRKEQKEQIEGVRTDVATTRSDLEATKQKLERTIGDLGIQSGLIAHTRDDLELLKHRGDRNYYEFTLRKGKQSTRVSAVNLQLKRANPKKGKYTLNVIADDRTIEKKDRTLFEPLQFYTGRDRQLYEVVVFTVDKNKVSGYLSAPKQLLAQAQ
jgi:DNA repair exonuclease SbcCD ATPase subunit